MKVRDILEGLADGTLNLDDEICENNINVLFRHCDDWEHIVICENGINISDGFENHKLDAIDILEELDRLGIIELEVEEIEEED